MGDCISDALFKARKKIYGSAHFVFVVNFAWRGMENLKIEETDRDKDREIQLNRQSCQIASMNNMMCSFGWFFATRCRFQIGSTLGFWKDFESWRNPGYKVPTSAHRSHANMSRLRTEGRPFSCLRRNEVGGHCFWKQIKNNKERSNIVCY